MTTEGHRDVDPSGSAPAARLAFEAQEVDPARFFAGTILLTAPHQDDCVLAFGATIARLGAAGVHVAYATDGAGSPEPPPFSGQPRPADLPELRRQEAREALALLGVPAENLHFLDFPDGELKSHLPELRKALQRLDGEIRPDHVLAPFRYDRHADHLALHRGVVDVFGGEGKSAITEYFIYHHSRLLPRRDLRAYVRHGLLRAVAPGPFAELKRQALERFRSQTARFYDWQTRPNLSAQLLDDVSSAHEVFLRYDPELAGDAVLEGPRVWIRIAHRMEPILKRRKDRLLAWFKKGRGHSKRTGRNR